MGLTPAIAIDITALQREIQARVATGEEAELRLALELAKAWPPSPDRIDDDFAQTLYELVLHTEKLGDWTSCADWYACVAEYDVTIVHLRAAAYFRRGLCLERLGDLMGAVRAYQRALPDSGAWPLVQGLIQFRLASLLMAAEEFAEAAGLLADLSENLPHAEIATAEVRLAHAKCLWRLRLSEPARQILEQVGRDSANTEYGVLAAHLLAEIEEASG